MGLYTKEDFLKEYEKSGWEFSDPDYRLAISNPDVGMNMLTYARDYQNAQDDAGRSTAHDNMERLRQAYGGYSAGADGSGYVLTGGATGFTYDPETDPLYKAYRKQYRREGDRQTRDTLASYAGMTGGVPSTAAVSAAQQAGNYYDAQLTDKIPELYQMYYNQFRQQLEDQRSADQYGRSIEASEKDSEWQKQYQLAQLAAAYGDYSPLYELMGRQQPQRTSPGTDYNGYQYTAPNGMDAKTVQQMLRDAGYNISVDGVWGPISQAAWEAYTGGGNGSNDTLITNQLNNDFPSGVIPAEEWDYLVSQGYDPGEHSFVKGN